MALPLADRIALFLSRAPATAQGLSRLFAVEVDDVHEALVELREQGAVTLSLVRGQDIWTLEPGVAVAYRPGRILIDQGSSEAVPIAAGRCQAETRAGDRCRLAAKEDGLCGIHGG